METGSTTQEYILDRDEMNARTSGCVHRIAAKIHEPLGVTDSDGKHLLSTPLTWRLKIGGKAVRPGKKEAAIMSDARLTLFFDGRCPFCSTEMQRLNRWDKAGHLRFIDIAQPDFDPAPLGADMPALNRELHSQTASGQVLIGIDSMLAAYTLVGRGWLVAPLRISILRPLLANLYRTFARHRYRLSGWLGYKPVHQCEEGICHAGNPFLKQ